MFKSRITTNYSFSRPNSSDFIRFVDIDIVCLYTKSIIIIFIFRFPIMFFLIFLNKFIPFHMFPSWRRCVIKFLFAIFLIVIGVGRNTELTNIICFTHLFIDIKFSRCLSISFSKRIGWLSWFLWDEHLSKRASILCRCHVN